MIRIQMEMVYSKRIHWFSILFFSLILLTLFSFTYPSHILSNNFVSLGSLWAIFEFVFFISLSKLYDPWLEMKAMSILALSPRSKFLIASSKIVFMMCYVLSIQVPIICAWIILFNIEFRMLFDLSNTFFFVLFFFNLSSSSIGVLMSSLVAFSSMKDVLLPILFFPLQSMTLISSLSLCYHRLHEGTWNFMSDSAWMTILLAYPIIFISIIFLLQDNLFKE
jgi:ABC-type transport system involved in cytochrome c biogenesis permease component